MFQRYCLIFRGYYLPGLAPSEVVENLRGILHVEGEQLHALLATPPVILKRNVDLAAGGRYQEQLVEAGLITHLEPVDEITGEHLGWHGIERRRLERRYRYERRAAERGYAILPDRRHVSDRRKCRF